MSTWVLFKFQSIICLKKPNIFLLYRLNSRASIRERFECSRERDLSDVINLRLGNVSPSKAVEEGTHIVSVLFSCSAHFKHVIFLPGRHCHSGWNPAHRLGKVSDSDKVGIVMFKRRVLRQNRYRRSPLFEQKEIDRFEFDHAHRCLWSVFGRTSHAFGDSGV